MVTLPIWLLLALPAVAQAPERPNVVLIISDDQGWRDFGFMGSTEVRTPHLDALAEESLVFPRGYVPTALCRASLATLVTGLYPHQHKITGNDPPSGTDRARMLAHIESVETLPRLLGVAGYRSLQTGKWWEGNCKCGGFSDGMTHGDPNRGGRHGDDGLTIGRETLQPALDFIDACSAKGVPFFLWYAPLLPHRPHDPPARILETYSRPNVPTPIARYRAMCTWFDETCGELLEHLAVREIEEKTLVVFVTDNGWIQRPDAAGYAPRSKRTPYEGGVRTPILVRWLGTIDPARCEVPVSSVDIASTILEACRLEVPAEWPGVDLRSDLRNRGPVFGAAFTHDVVAVDDPERSLLTRWVLRDPLKLLVHSNPSRPTELYDVRADPAEEHPLDNPEAVRALRADLDRWWPSRAGKDQLPDPDGKSADMRKPVQVYILMGQSNMLGFGKIKGDDGSLEHAVKEKGLYPYLVDDDGDWTVRQDVRNVRVMGSGTGGMRQFNNEFMTITSGNIGPEIGIGHHMGHVIKAPVLVLKSCVGNRSLGWDLLPPGSEQYEHEGKIYAGYKESPDSWDKGAEPEPIGWYAGMQYDGDVARAKKVLDELNKYYPDAKHYEVAGFFWWQGDKDRYNAAHASKYEDNLVRLIKQLRKEFDAPKAKFVIATLGQTKKGSTGNEGIILDAMLGVDGQSGKYPEFEGNVATVYSHPLSKGGSSNGHYSGNAETYMNIGEAMGKAMAELIEGKDRKSKRRR